MDQGNQAGNINRTIARWRMCTIEKAYDSGQPISAEQVEKSHIDKNFNY